MSPETELLTKLGNAAYGFFQSFLSEKKKQLETFFARNNVGFLPEGVDYSTIQRLKNKTAFKQLKFLIGKHRTLPIVLNGLWFSALSEEQQLKVAEENKNEIYQRYKEEGVNILNMAATGFMESFIGFLSNYNIRRNPSQNELIDIYEAHLKKWREITIFVKKDASVNYISYKCKQKMMMGLRFIYIFASYGAIKIAKEALRQIESMGMLAAENYAMFLQPLNLEGSRKVWIFEKQDIFPVGKNRFTAK